MTWVTIAVKFYPSSNRNHVPRFKGYHSKFPKISYRNRFEVLYSIVSTPKNTMEQEPEEKKKKRGTVKNLETR